jgi:hypothetical protein
MTLKKALKFCMPGLALGFGLLGTALPSMANPDFTKRTAKKCGYCHIESWSSKKYTEAGDYYRVHNTLKGYAPKPEIQSGTSAAAPVEAKPTQQQASSAKSR